MRWRCTRGGGGCGEEVEEVKEEVVKVSQPKLCICRYSQFLQLHQALVTRHHGQALRGFSFPKKQLTNNFRPDVLEERRLAFRSG